MQIYCMEELHRACAEGTIRKYPIVGMTKENFMLRQKFSFIIHKKIKFLLLYFLLEYTKVNATYAKLDYTYVHRKEIQNIAKYMYNTYTYEIINMTYIDINMQHYFIVHPFCMLKL